MSMTTPLRIAFGPAVCTSLGEGGDREWLVADGCGGYAMGTECGLRTRRYHGLLVPAVGGPSARRLGARAGGHRGAPRLDRTASAARGSLREACTFPGALLVGASGLFVVQLMAPDARRAAQPWLVGQDRFEQRHHAVVIHRHSVQHHDAA